MALHAAFSVALLATSAFAQTDPQAADSTAVVIRRDVFDVLHGILGTTVPEPELRGESNRGFAWSILPSIYFNPVSGWGFGASASGAGRIGSNPENRNSRLWMGGSYSTRDQLQLEVRGNLFLRDNRYLIIVDDRYLDTSRDTYGLGAVTTEQQAYPMDYKLLRSYLTVLRQVDGVLYAGLGFHYDGFWDVVDHRANAGESTPYVEYNGQPLEQVQSAGVSVNLLADARDNLVNPKEGFLVSASFRAYGSDLGSDFAWQEMQGEFRGYPNILPGSRNHLGVWIMNWFTFGRPPYLNLPFSGGDTYGRSARGYLQGRIRAENMIYVETEYRFELRSDGLLGAVTYLNMTATSHPETDSFNALNWASGVGLRIKFSKRSDTNLTMDLGWGEAKSHGFLLGMGEAF